MDLVSEENEVNETTVRISAASQGDVQQCRQIIDDVVTGYGGTAEATDRPQTDKKRILETGAIIEMLVGVPVGISIGLVANEIHRRILNSAEKQNDVTIDQADSAVVITHNETGLRIIISDPKKDKEPE